MHMPAHPTPLRPTTNAAVLLLLLESVPRQCGERATLDTHTNTKSRLFFLLTSTHRNQHHESYGRPRMLARAAAPRDAADTGGMCPLSSHLLLHAVQWPHCSRNMDRFAEAAHEMQAAERPGSRVERHVVTVDSKRVAVGQQEILKLGRHALGLLHLLLAHE